MPPPGNPEARLTLVALEGLDESARFFVRGSRIPIGRGEHDPSERQAIRLGDSTVSNQQAVIHGTPDGAAIEHCAGATNPTLVNGRAIERCELAKGDQVRMGAVVLEVISVVRAATEDSLVSATRVFTVEPEAAADPDDPRRTVERAAPSPWGRLVMLRGLPENAPRYFVLQGSRVTIGRNSNEDFQIEDPSVSRIHAELRRASGVTQLLARSHTNPTYVNGVAVDGPQILKGGEEIQLAERVAFRFDSIGPAAAGEQQQVLELEDLGLVSLLERKLERELELERELQTRFGAVGSFLDIDVVDSYGMKTEALRRDHIITSFNRFRDFATAVVEEHTGQVLNSNGDELMCFFESELRCVQAASALIERLAEFNRDRNLLTRPFRVRQGAHTGESLVDRERGVAYSPTLDIAGHLQKQGEVDGLMISEQTRSALPDGLPFEPAGTMERQGIPMFRLTGPLGVKTGY